jgi:hypothetical protein
MKVDVRLNPFLGVRLGLVDKATGKRIKHCIAYDDGIGLGIFYQVDEDNIPMRNPTTGDLIIEAVFREAEFYSLEPNPPYGF